MKEQIEKFKNEKIAIHTETQEEFDELMKLLKNNGIKINGSKQWDTLEDETCIRYGKISACEKDDIQYARISFYRINDYKIIKYKDFIKEGNDKEMMPTKTGLNFNSLYFKPIKIENGDKLERYIINNGATILFWSDKSKTISKRHKEDAFDKELGFLFAYFYKKCGVSIGARKRIIDCIDYSKIKTFLFEFYVKDSGKTYDQARSYLRQLKVEK